MEVMVQTILHSSHLAGLIRHASLGDRSSDEYRMVCAVVNRMTANCYRDYKLKTHNHLKTYGPSRLYSEMSDEDWHNCIDFFTSPTFVDKLVELRQTQQTQVTSSGASVACYCKGGSRKTTKTHLWSWTGSEDTISLSLNSTAASKAPEGTSYQFSGDPQNDDHWFAMHEAQLCRIQRKIQRLKNSIRGVVPEEEDEDEGIRDP
ncbi:Uncharacterized protein Adt_37893 [Abeliophyllum distichum]|uniref:Uncharacterized protein n=1 Tax=Abeliophyllum distichum TaxID=126358 RepID=A0ABD1Q0P4_9LAMI